MAERTRGSSEEMLVVEVEVVSSSRTPASLTEINSAAETSTREESAALTARGTMTMVVVRVTSGVKIEMTREVIEAGKVAELIEVETVAERGLGGKGIPFSNHSIWKQRRKGEVLIKSSASEKKVGSTLDHYLHFCNGSGGRKGLRARRALQAFLLSRGLSNKGLPRREK